MFVFTFTINYLISAMFYSDSTMHKIYEDEGSFDFTYQLPQMIYSWIISTILNNILNYLGMHEEDILSYKIIKDCDKATKRRILFKIKCKIVFFFIITNLLSIFFWIYLGCFCAIYKNTQIHLLVDVSLSFGISFISPFIIYLLPGMFRIPSLKGEKNRRYMYKFSQILQMLL